LILLSIYRARSPRVIGDGAEKYRRVWLATISVFGGVAIVSMLFKLEIARGYLMIALPVGTILLLAGRYAARQVVRRRRHKLGGCMTSVLVVGTAPAVRDMVRCLSRDAGSGFRVVGACVQGSIRRAKFDVLGVGTIPVWGAETDVLTALTETHCDAVALTTTEILGARGIRDLSWGSSAAGSISWSRPVCRGCRRPAAVDAPGRRIPAHPRGEAPVRRRQTSEKRAFDAVFAGFVLLVTLPLMLALTAAVKLSSAGPVFYRSERIGLTDKPFQMFKFRTMVAEADGGPVATTVKPYSRVTPLGRVLRKYRIDELPQFLNVLKRT
jgi:hypothetical protein